jgi:hypothetical membrane protein
MLSGKLAMVTGVLGAAWLLAMVIIGGATYPGYDHVSQFISELGATGAPQGRLVSHAGFFPVGVLICAFAVFAWMAAPRSLLATLGFAGVFLFAIGYVGATFFRCDYGCRPEDPSTSQMLHNTFGLVGYLFAPLVLLLLGLAARRWPNAGALSIFAFVTAAFALVAWLTLSPDSPYVGISQRVLEASMLSWVVACGLYLGRHARRESPSDLSDVFGGQT